MLATVISADRLAIDCVGVTLQLLVYRMTDVPGAITKYDLHKIFAQVALIDKQFSGMAGNENLGEVHLLPNLSCHSSLGLFPDHSTAE